MDLTSFSKKPDPSESSRLEVVSIHIPKTAGTSFYHILQNIYGPLATLELKRDVVKANIGRLDRLMDPGHRVLHGHFHYNEVRHLIQKDTKVITWLRDPVERVISNYSFFIKRISTDAGHPQHHRKNERILDYARLPASRNRMSDFLEGISLKELFFFGIMENIDSELKKLSDLMEWPEVAIPNKNANKDFRSKQRQISEQERKEILKLNSRDHELYQRALQLKASY